MEEKNQPRRRWQADQPEIELGPLGKEKGKILNSIKAGNMVAVLSGMELMYVLLLHGEYHCFLHALDSEDGRHKAWADNERNSAMLDNLYSAADALFEICFERNLDLMGVMVTAERGIVGYLDMTGNLPRRDMDFMEWLEQRNHTQEENRT